MGLNSCWLIGFNPRARMGRDMEYQEIKEAVKVSIHAPAWGATHLRVFCNPKVQFQSTRPHGARRVHFDEVSYCRRVSIHAPAWGATYVFSVDLGVIGFQSTRPHGARHYTGEMGVSMFSFQSTRPHGARRFALFYGLAKISFNPRARMGRDAFMHHLR